MGVYIKGMGLPTGENALVILPSGCVYIREPDNNQSFIMKNSSAKAISAPDGHGRLIDADALDTSILQAGFSYALTRRKLRYTPGDVRQKIANAPTIIPADELANNSPKLDKEET